MNTGYRTIYIILLASLALCVGRLASLHWPAATPPATLSQQEITEELIELEGLLQSHGAFLSLASSDWSIEWRHWQEQMFKLSEYGMAINEYQLRLSQRLSLLNDPNLHVSASHSYVAAQQDYDYQIEYFNDHFIAKNNRGRLLDKTASIVSFIDGMPLSRWINVIRTLLPRSQWQDQTKIAALLSQAHQLRPLLGINPEQDLRITLTNNRGQISYRHLPIKARSTAVGSELWRQYHHLKLSLLPLLQRPWFNQAHASDTLTLIPSKQITPKPIQINIEPAKSAEDKQELALVPNVIITEVINQALVLPQAIPVTESDDSPSPGQALDGEHWWLAVDDLAAMEDSQLQAQLQQALQYYPTVIIDIRKAHGRSQALLHLLNQRFGPEKRTLLGATQYTLGHYRSAQTLQLWGFSHETTKQQIKAQRLSTQLQRFLPARSSMPSEPARVLPARVLLVTGPECIQECEWLAIAARHWPRVDVIGQATQGRTGLTKSFYLPHSKLSLHLSTSLEFDANQQLISAHGISSAKTWEHMAMSHPASLLSKLPLSANKS